MTPEKIALVRSSWQQVIPIQDTAARLFYGRLFELDPSLRSLFKGDMAEQGRKLIATLAVMVGGLHSLPTIMPAVSALAKKHVDYGVTPAHYGIVREALMWTLKRSLGAGWTAEVDTAWHAAYEMLSDVMIGEAYGQALPGQDSGQPQPATR
jgi:hemoglobin-like flavoprotein